MSQTESSRSRFQYIFLSLLAIEFSISCFGCEWELLPLLLNPQRRESKTIRNDPKLPKEGK